MSQTNPKYKRLESLLSGAKPAEPDPAQAPVNEEVQALKAQISKLEAEKEQAPEESQRPTTSELKSRPALLSDGPAQAAQAVDEVKPPSRTPFSPKPASAETMARTANRIQLAFIAIQVLVVGFLVFLTLRTPTWQLFVMDGMGLVLMTAEIAGLALVRRGRHEQGVWLAFSVFLAVLFVIPMLYSGLGALFLISALTLTTLIGNQTLPPRQSRLFIGMGVVVGASDLLMDLYLPFQRASLPGFRNLIYFALVFLLSVLIYAIFRQFREYTLRTKLLVPIYAATIVIGLGIIAGNLYITTRQNRAQEAERLTRTQQVFSDHVQNLETLALGLATETANNPAVQEAIALGDRERMLAIMMPAFETLKEQFAIKQFHFVSPPAITFVRMHQPENFGDDLSGFRPTVVTANNERRPVRGAEIGRNGLGLRGVAPISYQGRHVGVLDVGVDLGAAVLEGIKQQYGMDAQILLDRRATDAVNYKPAEAEGAQPPDGFLLHASTLGAPFYTDINDYQRVLSGETVISRQEIDGKTFARISFPLLDFAGNVIGVVDLISDETAAVTAANRTMVISILAILAAISIASYLLVRLINHTLLPIGEMTEFATAIAGGERAQRITVKSRDELGILSSAFNSMTDQLQGLIGSLEQRVAERTQDLEVAAEVARAVSERTANIDVLLKDAVELIAERFHLYYTQIYLTDPAGHALILRAGSGEVGAELMRRGHRLPLNPGSINGRAAAEKRSVIVEDTASSVVFRPNPLLPNTRSEMSVPLIAGGKVLGVLDMQSGYAGALNEANLAVFEALAGQLAIAIENAGLFAETTRALNEVETQARRLARTSWIEYLNAIQRPEQIGFTFDQNKVTPLAEADSTHTPNGRALTAPISVTGEAVGAISVELEGQDWDAETREFVNAVARQVAQQIENLRLLESAERYRYEAEDAVRRLTREGWKDYINAQAAEGPSYLYDLKEVKPVEESLDRKIDGPAIALPLKVRDETVGKLSLLGLNPDDKDALEIANTVAERLSAHIENLRLAEQIEKRAAELATVADVSTTTSTVLDPGKLLQSVVDLTKDQFNLYHSHVYLMDESKNTLALSAGAGEVGRKMAAAGHSIPTDAERSLVARAARERRAVVVNDTRSEPDFLPNPLLPETRSEMALPMIVGENVLGVFDVQSNLLNHFTEQDINIYTTLTSQVAVSLQNARLYAEQTATVNQLRELDRLKSSFLANMSHELRTPLNSILGFSDVMLEGLDGPLTDNMDNDLKLIQKNGQHLLHLINDVLDMAKIESGRMNLTPEKFKVHEIFQEVTSITSTLASERNLALFVEDDSDREVEIFADRTRIRQVMINLVNNSIKFTEHGQISIHAARRDDQVLIRVKDTGIGIPADKIEEVFQEFAQVDSSTTRKAGGTGLGLPISRKLIQMHGGKLWAESSGIAGEGSTFHVELPLEARLTEPVEKLVK